MKKLASNLLWAALVLALPWWIYAIYIFVTKNVTKNPANDTVAQILGYCIWGTAALAIVSAGLYMYASGKEKKSEQWLKDKPKRDMERAGRHRLALFRIKRRYLVMVTNVLFLVGMVVWGCNSNGWILALIFLLILAGFFAFGYYMYWQDRRDVKELNVIRRQYKMPLRTKKFSFSEYVKGK
jgi:uncharacterized iron-regulated membrane protein